MYKINKYSAFAIFCYVVFLLFNFVYYSNFTVNWEYYSQNEWKDDVFYYVLNGDTAKAYYPRLGQLIDNDPTVAGFMALPMGHLITYFYYFLWLVFRYDLSNVMLVAFFVNNIMVVISYLYFCKIGREIVGLKMRWRGLYFLNPTIIYISQMISKEVMLLAFITMICYYSIKRRYIILYVISLMTFYVRGPFVLLAGIPIILREKSGTVRIGRFLFLVFLFMLVVGFFYSLTDYEIHWKSWIPLNDAGVTRLAIEWNYFYLGPLLMMLPKILGNFYDLIEHVIYPIQKGRLDLYHATTIPIVLVLLAQFRSIFYILLHPVNALRGACGPLLIFVIGYFVIVSANVYVHSRYIWPILPLFVLVLIGIRKASRNKEFANN